MTGIFPQGALNIIVTDEVLDCLPDNGLLLSDSLQSLKQKQQTRPARPVEQSQIRVGRQITRYRPAFRH